MKRIITILLLAALLLTSCGGTTPETTSQAETTGQTETDEQTETEPETTALEALPEGNFAGADYHMLGETVSNWWIISLYSDEMNGEIINDTVFERNKFVEKLYNVSISHTETRQAVKDIEAAVQSGTDDYDVVWEQLSSLIPPAQSGHLRNLYSFDGFAFDAAWWDTNSVNAFTINDKLFFACNDINVHTMEGCSAMYFSKTLVNINDLESPYTLVREGKWTLDKMSEMISAVIGDTNGNGTRDKGDTYGLVTGIGQFLSLINGAGDQLVIRESGSDGDTFTLNLATENVIGITEKVCSILNDKERTVIVNDDSWGYDSFYQDESLFYIMQLGSVAGIRDKMETDFGILPFPMKDEAQGYYTTSMESTTQGICIPVSAKETDMIEKVTEALAVYSDQYLIDAYYDTTLKGKIARDEDTTEMLDILTGTRTFDYASVYGAWNVYNRFYPHIQKSGGSELASFAASIQESFNASVQKTIEAYAKLEG